jgi:hypothetical protein
VARSHVVIHKSPVAAPSTVVPTAGVSAAGAVGAVAILGSHRRVPAGVEASALVGVATSPNSAALWSYSVPTQADEQATWDLLGMAWTASDKNTELAASPAVPTPDWHDDTEGDDLWTHYQMYRRTIATNPSQAAIYLAWAQAWRNRFVNDYVNGMSTQPREQEQGYIDHVYGQGMIVYAHFVTDSAALTAAGNVGSLIAAEPFTIGSTSMSFSGARGRARWLIVTCYLAEKIGAPWIALRNNIIDAWLQSPDWQTGIIGRMTFVSASEASYHPPPDPLGGTPAYNAGRRYIGTFHVALLAEALWRAYLATGRADVRARLVEMAYWCHHYASDPAWVNPMVGTYIGHESSGARFIRETDSGNANTSSGAAEYSLCLVNLMTMGYKLTGWLPFLNEAHRFLKIGQSWGAGAYGAAKQIADGQVHHFIDTLNNPDAVYFDYNKGELQYSYLVFENSGAPTVFAGT